MSYFSFSHNTYCCYTSQQFYGIVEIQEKRQSNTVVPKAEPYGLSSNNDGLDRDCDLGIQNKAKKLTDIEPVLKSLITYIIDQEINKYINKLHEQ